MRNGCVGPVSLYCHFIVLELRPSLPQPSICRSGRVILWSLMVWEGFLKRLFFYCYFIALELRPSELPFGRPIKTIWVEPSTRNGGFGLVILWSCDLWWCGRGFLNQEAGEKRSLFSSCQISKHSFFLLSKSFQKAFESFQSFQKAILKAKKSHFLRFDEINFIAPTEYFDLLSLYCHFIVLESRPSPPQPSICQSGLMLLSLWSCDLVIEFLIWPGFPPPEGKTNGWGRQIWYWISKPLRILFYTACWFGVQTRIRGGLLIY
jgi:hypothetical protein